MLCFRECAFWHGGKEKFCGLIHIVNLLIITKDSKTADLFCGFFIPILCEFFTTEFAKLTFLPPFGHDERRLEYGFNKSKDSFHTLSKG